MNTQGADLRDSGRWVYVSALLSCHKKIKDLKRTARSELKSPFLWLWETENRVMEPQILTFFIISPSFEKFISNSSRKWSPPSPQCRKRFHSLNTTFQGAPRKALEKRLKLIRDTGGGHTCPWFIAEAWTPWIGSGKTLHDIDLGKKSQTRNPQVLWTVFWMALWCLFN